MSYTETERAAITQFHAEQGKIDATNIEELANSLGKSVASVRAVAARAGLYTKSAGVKSTTKTASAEATEIAQYISKVANLDLPSLANMKLGELQLLRGFLDTITDRW